MKAIGLTVIALGSLSAAACQRTPASNSTDANAGTSVVVNSATIDNGLRDAGNFASDAGNSLGNGLSRAGDVIENTARTATNEVRDAVRHDGNTTNTSTNETSR